MYSFKTILAYIPDPLQRVNRYVLSVSIQGALMLFLKSSFYIK